MSGGEHDADLAELLELDGEAGPAQKISAAEADALLFAVLDAAASPASLASESPAPLAASAPARLDVSRSVLDAAASPAPAIVAARKPRAYLAIAAGIAFALFTGGAIAAIYFNAREPAPSIAPAPVVERAPEPEPPPPLVEAEPAPIEPVVEPAPAPKSARPPAEDLLAQANALRGQERWAAAEKAYSKVVRLHPRTQAAYVAAIAAGSLRLEHLANPRGAIEMFDRARANDPRGPLDADILFGIAAAHRALDDGAREKSTLQRLLQKHPSSVFAPGAKKRLAELEARR